ncbi:MAG: hypothetical protein ACPL3C_00675 [Pyrobaculum sp.]|uniref:hypothetical protein n=1 Tax=Pyrobaculum sp. TaxID=2004705 RepID=UPI003C85002E
MPPYWGDHMPPLLLQLCFIGMVFLGVSLSRIIYNYEQFKKVKEVPTFIAGFITV